jgi:NADPH:quinone reductase-like Zn-dependent oxidoreductase
VATMKAIQMHDEGEFAPLGYGDIPQPTPARGEVLIQVAAIGVNPVDWKLRMLPLRSRFGLPMPCIPGADVAGVVADVGEGVTAFKTGDQVFAMIGLTGAYAEYVCAAEAHVAHSPETLDRRQAASVPLAALTAWQALFEHGNLEAGQTALIHGAAGGVGGFAVQFARARGARVVATASAGNAAYVTGLGAQDVLDYRTDSAERFPQQVDFVLDLIGDDAVDQLIVALKPGGMLVQVAPGGSPQTAEKAKSAGVETLGMQVHPDGGQLREIAALIDDGTVSTTVAAVFPLAEAAQAHELSQQGHTRGKIVLVPRQ